MKLSFLAAVMGVAAQADFAGDASSLIVYARRLSSVVQTWNRRRGLSGALSIQRAYAPVSAAVGQLAYSSHFYSASDANAQAIEDLSAAVTGLLGVLSNKAADFQAVGARRIAANDISEILDSTEQIVSNIYNNVMDDCDHLSLLSQPIYDIEMAFNDAATILGAPGPNFPELRCVE